MDKVYDLLEKVYIELQDTKKELQNTKDEITEGFEEVNERLDRVENKLDDIESNNADRHVLIGGDIRKIKASLSKVEIITADNWGDIARLKAKRKHNI